MANAIIRGGIQGGTAMAPTMNPWAIGGGVLAGGLLGHLGDQEDEYRNSLIEKSNLMTMEGMKQQNQIGALNLTHAKRMEIQDRKSKRAGDIVGQRLSKLFSRIK